MDQDNKIVEKKVIGWCGVDSGLIMIGDPCYTLPVDGRGIRYTYQDVLDEFTNSATLVDIPNPDYMSREDIANSPLYKDVLSTIEDTDTYEAALDLFVSLSPPTRKVTKYASVVQPWSNDVAIIVNTLYGDGVYPVTAELNEHGQVVRMTIDFDPSEEEYYG